MAQVAAKVISFGDREANAFHRQLTLRPGQSWPSAFTLPAHHV